MSRLQGPPLVRAMVSADCSALAALRLPAGGRLHATAHQAAVLLMHGPPCCWIQDEGGAAGAQTAAAADGGRHDQPNERHARCSWPRSTQSVPEGAGRLSDVDVDVACQGLVGVDAQGLQQERLCIARQGLHTAICLRGSRPETPAACPSSRSSCRAPAPRAHPAVQEGHPRSLLPRCARESLLGPWRHCCEGLSRHGQQCVSCLHLCRPCAVPPLQGRRLEVAPGRHARGGPQQRWHAVPVQQHISYPWLCRPGGMCPQQGGTW